MLELLQPEEYNYTLQGIKTFNSFWVGCNSLECKVKKIHFSVKWNYTLHTKLFVLCMGSICMRFLCLYMLLMHLIYYKRFDSTKLVPIGNTASMITCCGFSWRNTIDRTLRTLWASSLCIRSCLHFLCILIDGVTLY